MRQRESDAVDRRGVERGLACDGANAVGAEEFACRRCSHDFGFLPRLREVDAGARLFASRLGRSGRCRLNAAHERAIGQARGHAVARGNLRRRANERALGRKHQGVAAIEHGQRRKRMQARVESV